MFDLSFSIESVIQVCINIFKRAIQNLDSFDPYWLKMCMISFVLNSWELFLAYFSIPRFSLLDYFPFYLTFKQCLW